MPPRRRTPSTRLLTGVEELDAALSELKLAVGNRVARSALTKGARVAAKRIKAAVPSGAKSVRRTIGSRGKKNRKGVWTAAAGAGVGAKRKVVSKGGTDGGKGIGGANVHWWFLGTQDRYTKRGKYTGRMPAVGKGIIPSVMAASSGEVLGVVKKGVREGIEREAVKARARGKSIAR